MDKVKLLREYKKLLERLEKATEWICVSKYDTWEEVENNQYKIFNEYKNVCSELQWMHEEMIKIGLIKGLGEATN